MKLTNMMMILSTISPFMNHPMTMGMILIIQTILMCMNMSLMYNNSWYSYILFITMIGGIMIMFMYMSSIASNEKFKYKKKMIIITTMFILMSFLEMNDLCLEMWNKFIENKMSLLNQEEQLSTMKMFNMNKANLTIMLILTLLLTMVSITNISSTFEGPLKKTYV